MDQQEARKREKRHGLDAFHALFFLSLIPRGTNDLRSGGDRVGGSGVKNAERKLW